MIEIGNSFDPEERLGELIRNLRRLEEFERGQEIVFSKCEFVTPFSIAPISIAAHEKGLTFAKGSGYLKTIMFPNGQEVSGYTDGGSTYFPLTRADLSGLSEAASEVKLRDLTSKYIELLQKNVIRDKQFSKRVGKDASYLLISEMVDNISEHSNAANCFIFSQYWPKSKMCEICLVDNGDGIYQSLLNANRDVDDCLDSIKKVIEEYLSAKDEFGSQKRGTGIKNTINLLSNNELNGFFCVISGDSGYYINSNGSEFYLALNDYFWNGTIVNMGFKKPQSKIDIYDYIR